MDITSITVGIITMFALSALADIIIFGIIFFIFYKIYKTKTIVTENNREIHEHDKTISVLQEKIDDIQNG